MSSSSARGQTEPIAALLAVLVVGAGLALYTDVLTATLDREPDRNVAAAALERVEVQLTPGAVADPHRLASVATVLPDGYEANVTLETNGTRWTYGPEPIEGADRADRTVSVRTAPASVDAGRLRVVVWK